MPHLLAPPPALGLALADEAKRLYLRYAVEVVEALPLCPFAAQARSRGQVTLHVVTSPQPTVEEVLAAMQELAQQPECIIGLIILPRAAFTPTELQHFVARVRGADAARQPLGHAPWALADFHPDGVLDLTSPERAVPFIRRTPDPTIQLVRQITLQAMRAGRTGGTRCVDPEALLHLLETEPEPEPRPLHEHIAEHNLRTLHDYGVDQLQEKLAEILDDRDRSYRRLGLLPPPRDPPGSADI